MNIVGIREMARKYIVGILIALMMLSSVGAYAQTAGEDARNPANDIVIVLDQSKSMNGDYDKSDPKGYRLDAAQMIIGMCDMDNSRVAFVPFADEVQKVGDNEFVNINTTKTRMAKMESIENLREKKLGYGTDLGNALSKAVKLLIERDDTTNSPMIIVITDGESDLPLTDKTDNIFLWDAATNSYSINRVTDYGVSNDNAKKNDGVTINSTTQQEDAVQAAIYNNLPIYTVGLKLQKGNDTDQEQSNRKFTAILKDIAADTNGQFIGLDSNNADNLPQIFGEMFASQIGSSLLEEFTPTLVDDTTNQYEVLLPILNQSVLEANIYIPLDNIDPLSVVLYDANGNENSRNSNEVVYLPSSRFILYKIKSPKVLGDWRLVFEMLDETESVSDISFSLLYNYNITLKTAIGRSIANCGDAGEGATLAKNGHMYITSSFYESDNGNNQEPSKDSNLYQVREGAAWKTIRVNYSLFDLNGNEQFSGELTSDTVKQFTMDIDLSKAYVSAAGYNQLRGGDYVLHVTASGAGLYRENKIAITLTNQKPEQISNALRHRIVVNDPASIETMNVQKDVEWDISQFVADPDNDKLNYEFRPQADADSIVRVKTYTKDDGSVGAVYETVMDPSGSLRSGTATYTLTATDQPDGESESWNFEFEVVSKTDAVLSEFKCNTSTTGIDASGNAKKNDTVTFEMNLTDHLGVADTTGAIKDFTGYLYLYDAQNTSHQLETIQLSLSDDKTKLVGSYQTGNESADILAVCEYQFGNQYAPDEQITFSVLNTSPIKVEASIKDFPKTITFDPLPAFLSFIETPTDQAIRTIDLSQFFTDPDNELGLTYSDPTITNGKGEAKSNIVTFRTDNSVEFLPQEAGSIVLTLEATDGDGASTRINIDVKVLSLVQKWLFIFAIAIALILVIILIALGARPYFVPGTTLNISVNVALQPDQICNVPRKQKALPLRAYVDSAVAERGGITYEDLSQLSIKPTRSKSGSVMLIRAMNKKSFSALDVQLNSMDVTNAPVKWDTETELVLRHCADASECVRIVLACDKEFSNPNPYTDDPLGVNNNDYFDRVPTKKVVRTKSKRSNSHTTSSSDDGLDW